jgi:RNA polymerase sigma-70 factor (ECF subfamily)
VKNMAEHDALGNIEASNAMSVEQLGQLFAEHQAELRRMVDFRLDPRLAGRLDPSDVLQEAFLAAAGKLTRLAERPGLAPRLWLRLEVGQALIDLHRRHLGAQRRTAARELSLDCPEWLDSTAQAMSYALVGSGTSPSEAAARHEQMMILKQALRDMDEHDREVLALRHFEGASNAEVAQILGIERKAASARYRRALLRLKGALDAWHERQGPGSPSSD